MRSNYDSIFNHAKYDLAHIIEIAQLTKQRIAGFRAELLIEGDVKFNEAEVQKIVSDMVQTFVDTFQVFKQYPNIKL